MARSQPPFRLKVASSWAAWSLTAAFLCLILFVKVHRAVRADGFVWFEEKLGTSVLSPATGVVTDLYADDGEWVEQGKPILKIDTLDSLMSMPDRAFSEKVGSVFGERGSGKASEVLAPWSGSFIAAKGDGETRLGRQVRIGEPIGFLVKEDELIFVAHVRPMDIAKVQAGMPCEIKVWAVESSQARLFSGKVLRATQARVEHKDGGLFYKVWCSIDDSSARKQLLRIGFFGRATIIAGNETLAERLVRKLR